MAFKKGCSGNPIGRIKGSKNKTTTEMKEIIHNVIARRLDQLDTDLNKMSDTNRWNLLEKLCKYVLPTLSKSEVEANIDSISKITVVYEDLNSIDTDSDDTE